MTQSELRGHIGKRVNIVNGVYALADTGDFVISEDFGAERVWLTGDGKSQCITNKPYIGRRYKLGVVDCVTLVCENLKNEALLKFYLAMGREELLLLQRDTVMSWLDADTRFTEIDGELSPGDVVVYSYRERMKANHIGIMQPGKKILHHLPGKLSSIDDIDFTKVDKGYKFNG